MAKLPAPSPSLVSALKAGQAIAIVGSGLTIAAGGPTWEELLLGIAAEAEETRPEEQRNIAAALNDIAKGAYLNGASLLKTILGSRFKDAVVHQIRYRSSVSLDTDALGAVLAGKEADSLFHRNGVPQPRRLRPRKSHKILVQMNFRAIVTTNYDMLLEDALPDGSDLAYYSRSYAHLANRIQENQRFILKLHGDIYHKEDIVLARSDYPGAQFDPVLRKAVTGLFQATTPFWIGYGHNDPDLDSLIDQMKVEMQLPGGFAVIRKGQISLEQRLRDASIFPAILDSHEQIDDYLEQLAIASGTELSVEFTIRVPWGGQEKAQGIADQLARELSAVLGKSLAVSDIHPGSVKVTLRGQPEAILELIQKLETGDDQITSALLSHGVAAVAGEHIERSTGGGPITVAATRRERLSSPRLKAEVVTPRYGRFTAGPYEYGMAVILGNSLRRCLLSAMEGAAITAVKIEGVLHEFSWLPGIMEDVTEIILNLKQVPIRLSLPEPRIVSVELQGPRRIAAVHLATDPAIAILNPDLHIATLNEEGQLKLQFLVQQARGYVSAERNLNESLGVGWIPLDSAHNPIQRVNFRSEPVWLGGAAKYERLVLEVWTNGTIAPDNALTLAASLLDDHLGVFAGVGQEHSAAEKVFENQGDELLSRSLNELDLSIRSVNALKRANIHTLRDLVRKEKAEVMATRNLGKKSFEEIQDLLDKLGLSLGIDTRG